MEPSGPDRVGGEAGHGLGAHDQAQSFRGVGAWLLALGSKFGLLSPAGAASLSPYVVWVDQTIHFEPSELEWTLLWVASIALVSVWLLVYISFAFQKSSIRKIFHGEVDEVILRSPTTGHLLKRVKIQQIQKEQQARVQARLAKDLKATQS